MSIRIQKSKCAGCGRCIEACPGNLIKKDKENKAFIRQVRDCWGCTSCIKECRHDAIRFFLGADVGGRGASMVVSEKPDISTWTWIHRRHKHKIRWEFIRCLYSRYPDSPFF